MRSKSRRRQSSRPSPANGFGGKRRRKEMRQKVPRRALRAEWTLFRRHGRAPAGQRMMASWFRRLCVKCAAFLSPLYQKDTHRRLSGIVSTTSTTVLLENAAIYGKRVFCAIFTAVFSCKVLLPTMGETHFLSRDQLPHSPMPGKPF